MEPGAAPRCFHTSRYRSWSLSSAGMQDAPKISLENSRAHHDVFVFRDDGLAMGETGNSAMARKLNPMSRTRDKQRQ
jgi:hypothetical protein